MINFSKNIDVKYDVDVFVAGGGPAGVAAAIAAARCGKKVYIADSQACFGGLGTAGLIPAFMTFSDGVNFLAKGIGEEVLARLTKVGGAGPIKFAKTDGATINVEKLKRVYDDMILEENIKFSFFTNVIDAQMNGDKIEYAILQSKSGIFAVKAKTYVDCTGDGDLCVMAGAPYEKGDKEGNIAPGTLCSLWANIDWEKADKITYQDAHLKEAIDEGIFTVADMHMPGMWRTGNITGGANLGHAFGVDGTDEVSLSKAIINERKRLLEYEKYYKKYLDGYKDMELVVTGAMLGIRETRRIMGEYVLCLDDFEKRASFDDEIGRYCYPVDIHASKPDAEDFQRQKEEFNVKYRYADGESYGIPFRCLVPKNVSNLTVAGRCISADRYMQGSIRVMPGCYITGQAAGIGAAIAAEDGVAVKNIDIKKLQNKISSIGKNI